MRSLLPLTAFVTLLAQPAHPSLRAAWLMTLLLLGLGLGVLAWEAPLSQVFFLLVLALIGLHALSISAPSSIRCLGRNRDGRSWNTLSHSRHDCTPSAFIDHARRRMRHRASSGAVSQKLCRRADGITRQLARLSQRLAAHCWIPWTLDVTAGTFGNRLRMPSASYL